MYDFIPYQINFFLILFYLDFDAATLPNDHLRSFSCTLRMASKVDYLPSLPYQQEDVAPLLSHLLLFKHVKFLLE